MHLAPTTTVRTSVMQACRALAALVYLAAAGPALAAQSPASAAAPAEAAVPQTPEQALAQDAAEYARAYAVPQEEALARLRALAESVVETDRLRGLYRDRLAGIVVEHAPAFRIVVLLTGEGADSLEVLPAGGLALPILFRTGAPAKEVRILAAIGAHQADIRAVLDHPPGMGADPRTGMLAVMVQHGDLGEDGEAGLAARLAAIAGVPAEIKVWSDIDAPSSVEGGGRVLGADPGGGRFVCTSGFVVTDGLRTAVTTAAHCPDALSYIAPDHAQAPLTMVGAWGAGTQDVQVHVGEGQFLPFFLVDRAKDVARPLTGQRLRASTRAGDFVCHRGEHSGYHCAEVDYPDYAPPGDLCAGPCPPTWVAVHGPDCHGGDSGGPVFLGTIAFGTVKGASYTSDGACRLYYYMSTDYLPPGWSLLRAADVAGGP